MSAAGADGDTEKESRGSFLCHDSTAVTLGKRVNPLDSTLEANTQRKNTRGGVGDLAQWQSACLASARPWVRSPALKKK